MYLYHADDQSHVTLKGRSKGGRRTSCLQVDEFDGYVQATGSLNGRMHVARYCRTHHLRVKNWTQINVHISRFPDLFGVLLSGGGETPDGTVVSSPVDLPLEYLVPGCRNLFCLELFYCEVVTDGGLATVLEGCKRLRTLELTHCGTLTGTAFQAIQCKDLQILTFNHCANFTCEGLTAVARSFPSLLSLRVLMDKRWGADFAAGLEIVTSLCPRLIGLSLQACGLTDLILHKIAVRCPLLSIINVRHESAITDAGVASLRIRLSKLETLILHGNHQLLQGRRDSR